MLKNYNNKEQLQTFDKITKIAARLPGFEQCDQNDLHRWLEKDIGDPGFQILTDEEIVGSVLAETNDEVLTDEEECDPSNQKVTNLKQKKMNDYFTATASNVQ